MLFHLLLVVSPFFITAYPQNSNKLSQVDGFVFDGPTAGGQSSNEQQRTITTTTTESTSGSMTTTPLRENVFDECVRSCPVTQEYNPVCGTDNVDYTNPGGLGCAKRCGKEVILKYYGRCSTGRAG
ncbi:PREDICTED: uncharacterized protein LOC106746796 [Dinoponera quadriceps]|uniref:Uncharacterized protein LOC106746796 n=1 Tax=Dinoponera quadriceps TaxID=609295 RepID=A0A6P3XN04_DINQU|nr:PREDICTED: uncharacterized protein LOC106746796 [Dinoponera quadriceps]